VNSEQLKSHVLELVGVVWLVIVAVQHLCRYFLGIGVDFRFAYVGMLVLTIAAAVLKRSDGVME